MNDHRFAEDLIYGETVSKKSEKCPTACAKKGRHIPRVVGVGAIVGVVMGTRIGKRIILVPCARRAAMDMERKDIASADTLRGR